MLSILVDTLIIANLRLAVFPVYLQISENYAPLSNNILITNYTLFSLRVHQFTYM